MKIKGLFLLTLYWLFAVSCGGGGGGGGFVPASPGGGGGDDPPVVVISATASRTAGVGPLSVFFNAAIDSEDDAFHALSYVWDFGDPTSGSWALSGKSKNAESGPVAAHIYETPGVYTATLTARDETGIVGQREFSITVNDPEAVYAGTNTICISDNADFNGCPAGAGQVTTTDILDMEERVAAGRRVLLRRGASWTTDGAAYYREISGPVTIGAYGACSSPDERGICANAPLIHLTGGAEGGIFNLYKTTDWRIQDLHITGDTTRWGATGGATDWRQLLFLRLKMSGFNTPLGNSHWDTDGHDQITVADCDISDADSNILYIGSERLALLGNRLRNPAQSHVLRVWQAYLGVISHNEMSGASLYTTSGRHALKFHGPNQEILANAGNGESGLVHPSRFVVIANNVFGSSGPWQVCVGPQYEGIDERLRDIIVEKNRFLAGWGAISATPVQAALLIWASKVTVRNNLFDGTGSSSYYTGLMITRRGNEPAPDGNRVYHNTIYKAAVQGAYTSCEGIRLGEQARRTIVRNNLAYLAPEADLMQLFHDDSPDLTESHNFLAANNQWIDPDNANFLLKDFRLRADSVYRDQGTAVPVLDDFAETVRPQGAGFDPGAFERI